LIAPRAGLLLLLAACDGSSGGFAGSGSGADGGVSPDAATDRIEAGFLDAGFAAVPPCNVAASYAQGVTTILFGGTAGYVYAPSCLKVAAGTTVTFSGDFAPHPLSPSAMRGTSQGNPIANVSAGAARSFTFPSPGFFAYFCSFHGIRDDGSGMAGVIWVE
jgi:plastocyanin